MGDFYFLSRETMWFVIPIIQTSLICLGTDIKCLGSESSIIKWSKEL